MRIHKSYRAAATSIVGGIRVGATAISFIVAMKPSARAQAAGEPVEVDIGKPEPGQQLPYARNRFTAQDVRRLGFVRNSKSLTYTLFEIGRILDEARHASLVGSVVYRNFLWQLSRSL